MTLSAPAEGVIDAVTAASSAVEPTLQSLGLASSSLGGVVQAGLENIHVSLGVPWWTAIVLGMYSSPAYLPAPIMGRF